MRVPSLLALLLAAAPAWAQSETTTTVGAITITVASEASQSVTAKGDGAVVEVDGRTVTIGPGRIESGGVSMEGDPFAAVRIESAGGGLRVLADGEEVLSLSGPAGGAAEGTLDGRAAAGDAGAMNDLAVELFEGRGRPADPARAQALMREAADGGDVAALGNLAWRLWDGTGVPQDRAEAVAFARRAAVAGHAGGMALLGLALGTGDGVAQDGAEAVAWLERAAAAGDPDADYFLGFLYGTGAGVPLDPALATEAYRRAAEAGHMGAALNLAWLYVDSGLGPTRDEAIRWATAARDAGVEGAGDALARLQALPPEAPPGTPAAEGPAYFWADGRTPTGPVTLEELRALAAAGTVGPDTLVWEEGTPDWVRSADLPALAP